MANNNSRIRIISGTHGGREIDTPKTKATHPMGERERAAIFNSIRAEIYGRRILDAFAGSGGGTFFTGKTEFERTEDECLSDFDIVKNSVEQSGDSSLWNSLILISHNPPVGEKIDSFDGEHHAGSQKFTDFIKENKPLAVVCGHIHEGTNIEKIGDTVVINPGSLGEAQTYAWLEVEKDGDGWKVVKAEMQKL